METPIAPPQSGGQGGAIVNVSGDWLKGGARQSTPVATRAKKGFHPMSAAGQLMDQVGAEETGSACDKAVHERVPGRG